MKYKENLNQIISLIIKFHIKWLKLKQTFKKIKNIKIKEKEV